MKPTKPIEQTAAPGATSPFDELNKWAQTAAAEKNGQLGFPGNQDIKLKDFYRWYVANGLIQVCLNNAGDPFCDNPGKLTSHRFEREVIEYFAPLYGFETDNVWGLVTNSGSDGNNHGIYFGNNFLKNKTGKDPVLYVSDEAHYSNMRLAHLQGIDTRLIKSDDMGRMIPEELDKSLIPDRPCIIVFAMGSTFKGAIDDQNALNAVLDRYPSMKVFRHVDAALFGGYLPFTRHKDIVDRRIMRFDSIAVSGHKFFGMDEPAGLFITSRDVYERQRQFNVAYLNEDMKMINCSRSSVDALKFWWLIRSISKEEWAEQANQMLENTGYLVDELRKFNYPCWVNELSNTVFIKRPPQEIVERYCLSCNYDERFGGPLAHIVVMQHVTRERIDKFVEALKLSCK